MYFEEPVNISYNNDITVHIVMPKIVRYIYFSGSGIDSSSEAMIWYFETYYGVKKDELLKAYKNGTIGALIKECTDKYGFIEPKSTDVDTILNVIDVTRNIDSFKDNVPSLYKPNMYRAGLLKDENGNIIEDCDRIYFGYDESKNYLYLYLPEKYIEQMKKHCEETKKDFSYDGNLVWNYLDDYCNPTEEEMAIRKKNWGLSARLIECLANYRASEGFVEQH